MAASSTPAGSPTRAVETVDDSAAPLGVAAPIDAPMLEASTQVASEAATEPALELAEDQPVVAAITAGQEQATSESSSGSASGSSSEGDEAREEEVPTPAPTRSLNRRKGNQLPDKTYVITRVDDVKDIPASPHKAAKTFSNACGCLVREQVKITCKEFGQLTQSTKDTLLRKLWDKYQIPEADKERVEAQALKIMARALKTWRYDAQKVVDEDWDTKISKRWSKIQKEDWDEFVAQIRSPEFQEKSLWGKELRRKNTLDHKLGSRGYLGKRPKWAKEDEKLAAAGKAPPFAHLREPRAREYMRAHTRSDPVTGSPIYESEELQVVADRLVTTQPSLFSYFITLHPNTLSSHHVI